MKTNQIADIQISLHYLTMCVESMQREQKERIVYHPLTFQPDIANVLHACVGTQKRFSVLYSGGRLDRINIYTGSTIDGEGITVRADGTAYMVDSELNTTDVGLAEVMKDIAGF